MKRGIIILLLSLSLFSCKGQDKEVVKQEEVAVEEPKKVHWRDLPQYVDPKEETYKEVMKGREEKYQQAMKKIIVAGTDGIPDSGFSESEYSIHEINLMNELYYDGLKSMGFQFPSEEVFAKRINEIYGVDITQDQSNNPRVRRVGDFLILVPKLHAEETYKEVPMLVFSYPCIVFDIKRRFYARKLTVPSEEEDDYEEYYYQFGMSTLELAYNNYIFYNNKAALVRMYSFMVDDLAVSGGYDDLPFEALKDYQKEIFGEFRQKNQRAYWDYRMYERFLFARDFNGNLKPRTKMLEAMVELAKEDSDYARIPFEYYTRQIKGVYSEGEYSADLKENIDPYKNPEPYYTKEERAKIWAYLAYYEAEFLEDYKGRRWDLQKWAAGTYAESSQSISGYFYQIAKSHDFYGLDFSKVEELFRDIRGDNWEEIITSWEVVEPKKI